MGPSPHSRPRAGVIARSLITQAAMASYDIRDKSTSEEREKSVVFIWTPTITLSAFMWRGYLLNFCRADRYSFRWPYWLAVEQELSRGTLCCTGLIIPCEPPLHATHGSSQWALCIGVNSLLSQWVTICCPLFKPSTCKCFNSTTLGVKLWMAASTF